MHGKTGGDNKAFPGRAGGENDWLLLSWKAASLSSCSDMEQEMRADGELNSLLSSQRGPPPRGNIISMWYSPSDAPLRRCNVQKMSNERLEHGAHSKSYGPHHLAASRGKTYFLQNYDSNSIALIPEPIHYWSVGTPDGTLTHKLRPI